MTLSTLSTAPVPPRLLVSSGPKDCFYAVEFHAYGRVSDDPTIGTCWDADGLQLTRIGTTINPRLPSTTQARTY